MNKEEYDKLSTYDKIDYDIAMKLYFKYNDTIATMNDHLGEMYCYSDLKEVEDAEKQDELDLYKKTLKEKCDGIDRAIEYIINKARSNCRIDQYDVYALLKILKGDNNE